MENNIEIGVVFESGTLREFESLTEFKEKRDYMSATRVSVIFVKRIHLSRFTFLPTPNGNEYVEYFGDMAKFVYANL